MRCYRDAATGGGYWLELHFSCCADDDHDDDDDHDHDHEDDDDDDVFHNSFELPLH